MVSVQFFTCQGGRKTELTASTHTYYPHCPPKEIPLASDPLRYPIPADGRANCSPPHRDSVILYRNSETSRALRPYLAIAASAVAPSPNGGDGDTDRHQTVETARRPSPNGVMGGAPPSPNGRHSRPPPPSTTALSHAHTLLQLVSPTRAP